MRVIYAPEPISEASGPIVFLAGPTPRSPNVKSWRPDALTVLAELGFNGTVLVPEDRSGQFRCSYDDQIEWETQGLQQAHCIMFWVPRKLPDMPGLTTNDEWGTWKRYHKVVWGNPPEAEKVAYQRRFALANGIAVCDDLRATAKAAIALAVAYDKFVKRAVRIQNVAFVLAFFLLAWVVASIPFPRLLWK